MDVTAISAGIVTVTASGGGGGGINNLDEDTTPQLGGNLDLNGFNITGSGTIPAPNLTGALPAIDGSALTGIGTASSTVTWTLGASGSSHYTFAGIGITADTTNDPTIFLQRGATYAFVNNSGGSHPFRIQHEYQNTGGQAYNVGVTNNGASNGTITFQVPMNAPINFIINVLPMLGCLELSLYHQRIIFLLDKEQLFPNQLVVLVQDLLRLCSLMDLSHMVF